MRFEIDGKVLNCFEQMCAKEAFFNCFNVRTMTRNLEKMDQQA